jgi:uncharacterized integral membrane protein
VILHTLIILSLFFLTKNITKIILKYMAVVWVDPFHAVALVAVLRRHLDKKYVVEAGS